MEERGRTKEWKGGGGKGVTKRGRKGGTISLGREGEGVRKGKIKKKTGEERMGKGERRKKRYGKDRRRG